MKMKKKKSGFSYEAEFVAEMLHELKTPITSVKGYACLLLTNELGPTNVGQNKILTKVVDRCDFLTDMLTKFLQFSKPSPFLLDKEKIDLSDMVMKNINAINVLADKNKVKITPYLPKEHFNFWGSQKDFNQIISNLLSNAVKFNRENGKIDVCLKKQGNYIMFSVTDTGMGIPSKVLPKIFNRFYSGEYFNPKGTDSTGLGLSIVKRVIESYNGKIECKSKLNSGTTFTAKLPVLSDKFVFDKLFHERKKAALKEKQPFSVIVISFLNWKKIKSNYNVDIQNNFIDNVYSTLQTIIDRQDKLFLLKDVGIAAILGDTKEKGTVLMKYKFGEVLEKKPSLVKDFKKNIKPEIGIGMAVFPKNGKTKPVLLKAAKNNTSIIKY